MTRTRDELDAIIASQPRPGGNGRWRIDPRLAMSIVGWIVTIAIAWGGFNARLAVEEARREESERRHEIQQIETDRRMQRLEEKVDILLRRP